MRTAWALGALLSMGLALGACSKQGTAERRSPPNLNSPAATASRGPNPQQSKAPAEKPGKGTQLREDATETIDQSTADSGAHNPLLAAVASTISGSSTANAAQLPGPALWQEGVNYTRLVPAQPTNVPAGQVEVLEFFWYACPHCYALEPQVQAWLKTKPGYVSFARVPVLWNEGHRSQARLYYTLEALGKLPEMHEAVFKEIHLNNDPLISPDPSNAADSERLQANFARRFGVAEDDFRKAYHSMGVDTSVRRADSLVERYRVTGVPTFVVNGKYIADVGSAGSPEKLVSLVGDLAAAESKH